jgi:hypothetical protein
VRNRIPQFVLFLGALLCLGNGGSLLAGTITRTDLGVTVHPHAETEQTHLHEDRLAQAFARQPSSADESSAHPEGRSLHAVPQTPTTAEFTSLHGDKGSAPHSPPQPMPDGRGSGGMGVVPSGPSREPSVAVLAFCCEPIQEATEILGFQSFQADSDPGSTGLFRPPR